MHEPHRLTYSGSYAPPAYPSGHQHPPVAAHGFCQSCCHPKSKCGCGCRQCRKEPKELLVQAKSKRDQAAGDVHFQTMSARAGVLGRRGEGVADFTQGTPERATAAGAAAAVTGAVTYGTGTAFIGGGCCVHLSIEYVPTTPTAQSIVLVLVDDSEGTLLAWGKLEKAGVGYQVKECIITTKPGADLSVLVLNMTARIRWCEVFSC